MIFIMEIFLYGMERTNNTLKEGKTCGNHGLE